MASATDGSPRPAPALDVRLLVDNMPMLAWSSHADGSVDFVNQQWREYTGLSTEESHGPGLKAAVHPDDLPGLLQQWETQPEANHAGEYEVRLRRSDGVFRWFSIRREPLHAEEDLALTKGAGHVARIAIERQRSQETLRNALDQVQRSEARLRQVIDTIPTLAWCNLSDGPNEFLNKKWHEYTGLSPEESHGWGWQVAFHPEDLPLLMEKWRELLVSGEPGEIEARLRRHDGVFRWFLIRVEPLRDQTGKVIRWYGTSTDIQELKQTEEKLRDDERELRRITDAIPQAIVVLGPAGEPLYANQATLDYTGLTADDVVSPGFRERMFHPEDLDQFREKRKTALERGLPFEAEMRALRNDGEYRWFLIRYNPFRNEQGQ